ncbi:MAG: tRNA (adenosine(37)-N6)-dimethylallyltransferase MiaA [Actinomycetota bacterium]
MPAKDRVAALVGPTAVGKTAVAAAVARALDAEIVSIDSMQVYRGMDIGTAKPPRALLDDVTHHLVDVFPPERAVSVAEFQGLARAAIREVTARGRLPLLVGGSGLYFRAVVDDLSFPPHAPDIRSSLEAEADNVGAEALHARLTQLDPEAASKIEPGNARRTIRALEVITTTGRRFSENATAWERYESIYELAVAGLRRPRAELYERVADRVDAMLAAGLVVEVMRLRESLGPSARQALGYKQVLEMHGAPLPEIRDEIVKATKRFARRQESWFAADPRIEWFEAAAPVVSHELIAYYSQPGK